VLKPDKSVHGSQELALDVKKRYYLLLL